MPPIDDRTPILNLALPNQDNFLADDVARIRSAFSALDTAVAGKQPTIGFTPENAANKGQANGYAPLGSDSKVAAAYLPSYVDDVLEYATLAAFPGSGETGKIYVAQNTNKTYRWSGSAYVEISPSPGSTDAVTEGATNLYFTAQRARDAQQPATTSALGVVKVGTGLSVAVDGTVSVSVSTQAFTDVAVTVTTNGQTSFTVPGGYVPGLIDVRINGATLAPDDFVATNGTSVALSEGAQTTDSLVFRCWSAFDVANAVKKNGDTLQGPLHTKQTAVVGSNIDLAAGNCFSKTISANTTLTVSNVPAAGAVASFLLDLTNGGAFTVTWWSGVKWPGGAAPTLTASGRDVLGFFTYDGGTTWTGVLVGRDVK
jgi:hypothetical protein